MTSANDWTFQSQSQIKTIKPEVPSHKPSSHITLWDVKEPTHYSKRVGDVVPGVVVYLRFTYIIITHHGLGGFSGLINGLVTAAIGALRMLMSEPTAKR